LVARFLLDRSGATAIEYGLIASVLSIMILGGVLVLGQEAFTLFGSVARRVIAALAG